MSLNSTSLLHLPGPSWLTPHKMAKAALRPPFLRTRRHPPGMFLPGRNREQSHTQRHLRPLTCNFAIGFRGRLPIYNYGPRFSLFTHNCHILGWRSRNYKIIILSVIPIHFNLIHPFLNPFHLEGTMKGRGKKDKASWLQRIHCLSINSSNEKKNMQSTKEEISHHEDTV